MKLTVDAVVFSYIEGELKVLLIKRAFEPFKGQLALAGGYVQEDETTEQAVLRKLKDETGVNLDYLEQLYTFSDVERDPRGRIITVAYYGLIAPLKTEFTTNKHASDIGWYDPYDISFYGCGVAFDHMKIINYALGRLRNKIRYESIGFDLLPQYFTMTELYMLYTSILEQEIDRRNFLKKFKKFNLLKEAPFKNSTGGKGRKAQLYEFDEEKYLVLKRDGFNFDI
jgi:8-oxo-dGTP diphosphatase